jgi:hypothetical protein
MDEIEERNRIRAEAGLPPLDVEKETARLAETKRRQSWYQFVSENTLRAENEIGPRPSGFMASIGYGVRVRRLLKKWYET